MPKVKKKHTTRQRPYPEHSVEYSHFIKSSRSGRRNAVANILDEPQVAANLPILTLPADLSELKVTDEVSVSKKPESSAETKALKDKNE